MSKDFDPALPGGFHKKIEKVKTMQQMRKAVIVNGKPVYDAEDIFPCLFCGWSTAGH